VIVRIATEGQYELPASDAETLTELDNRTLAACRAGNEEQFDAVFKEMLSFVRDHGQPVPEDQLVGSEVILPPPDSTMAEATAEFTGEGLIPD
jgi:hypothetical protein